MKLLARLRAGLRVLYDPVEQARAKRNIGYSLLGLVIIGSAQGLVQFFLGDRLSQMPSDFQDMANKFLTIVFGIAYVVAIAALIWNAIRLHTAD